METQQRQRDKSFVMKSHKDNNHNICVCAQSGLLCKGEGKQNLRQENESQHYFHSVSTVVGVGVHAYLRYNSSTIH